MALLLDALQLPDDLVFKNEFDFTVVAQSQKRSITGALLIQESVKIKGRKIQLFGDETSAWMPRSDVVLMKAKVDTPDNVMVLTYDSDTYNVKFDHIAGAFTARPIIECTDPADDAPYSVVINLITV